ncbi:MAG: DUF3298 and DUF4163 domain-containing protein [Lachnospiraceae bacterium]
MQTIENESINNMLFYRDIPVLIYHIAYPIFHSTCNQKAVESINEVYRSLARDREYYCKWVLYPQAVEIARYIQENNPPFHPFEFNMMYQVTLNKGCVTSLYLEQYTYLGGAHGATIRTSDTWNFVTGKKINLKDFYTDDSMFEDKIIVWIENKISELLTVSPGNFFEDYANLLRNTFNPDSFYLTPEGIVIYFQQYDIAPYAAGIVEFLLPNSAGKEAFR